MTAVIAALLTALVLFAAVSAGAGSDGPYGIGPGDVAYEAGERFQVVH